jgi:histidinol-phosphate/aromatic aminotransferase/cobyric acid decarboxylase-like protein/choline kinase
MQGIILAAGMGKRLKELTQGNTKCMVKVNGRTMIERALSIFDKKGLSRIVLVVGYEGQRLIEYVNSLNINTPIVYIENKVYDKTNNIFSLALAKDYLMAEDTLLLESDLVFEEGIIDSILQDKRSTLALVDKFESWMDGTCMTLDEEDCIVDFIAGKNLRFDDRDNYYKTVNIYKFSRHFSENTYVPFLEAYEKAMGNNEYYESVIKLIAMLDTKEIRAKRLESGLIWYEIDDIQDLDIAETLFTEDSTEKYKMLSARYGGYWRYPKLLDYCYLVNPYYPPRKMLEEMRSNFDTLITQYPSGMAVNSLLAGKYFGVNAKNIVIGNGAAELIEALMETLDGTVGFIRPTFEEYPHRTDESRSVYMVVDNDDFSYDENDIIRFFTENPVDNIVLINPDNPSGNYIPADGVQRLISWCRDNSVRLILDESFVDFCGDGTEFKNATFISEEAFKSYSEGLIVVKSISKSFGVPGIRLGILAGGNEELVSRLKKKVAIWNINSFGEFYMQIAEKYKKDYDGAMQKICRCREELAEGLKKVSYLRPVPSQANYIMCEVLEGRKSIELAAFLLERNIFIKDLTSKIGNGKQYIRLAVRAKEDNERLLKALAEYGRQA